MVLRSSGGKRKRGQAIWSLICFPVCPVLTDARVSGTSLSLCEEVALIHECPGAPPIVESSAGVEMLWLISVSGGVWLGA
jgi:hypothetical protein